MSVALFRRTPPQADPLTVTLLNALLQERTSANQRAPVADASAESKAVRELRDAQHKQELRLEALEKRYNSLKAKVYRESRDSDEAQPDASLVLEPWANGA